MKNNASTILSLDNVCYGVNNILINSDITFKVNYGDSISIIGPNGSGKTTLLRLISNDIKPSSGQIIFKNKNIINWDINSISTKRAILPQNSYISFPFTVYEIIQMGRYPYPENKSLNKKIINNIIDIFDLSKFKDREFTTLSGGEKQRVQLGRVFAQIWREKDYSGKLLILDEPTSFLDINHQIHLFEILKDFREKGLTILMVLHDINHAILNSNKIAMLKKAELMYFGDTDKIINVENLNDVFDVKMKLIDMPSKGKPLVHF